MFFKILLTLALLLICFLYRLIFRKFKVNKNSRITGGDLIARIFKQNGIDTIYTLCGGHISGVLVGCRNLGINVIDVRHEGTAAFAAEAYGRLAGPNIFGVAVVTAGPGLTNTITAVRNASMSESPMLVIAGAVPSFVKNRGALQDVDQVSLMRNICKHSTTVDRVSDLPYITNKLIQVALNGVPGPVFLEVPIHLLYPYDRVYKESVMTLPEKTITQKIVKFYLNYIVDRSFHLMEEKLNEISLTPLKIVQKSHYKEESCARYLCKLLYNSKNPVFLLGSQAVMFPTDKNDVKKALLNLQIPFFASGMTRSVLNANDNLNKKIYFRQNRKEAVREADLIVLLGAICDFRLGYGKILNKKAKIVSVNRDASKAGLNNRVFWSASKIYECDPATVILKMSKAFDHSKRVDISGWLEKLAANEAATNEKKFQQSASCRHQKNLVNPVKFLSILSSLIDDNACLIVDGGDFVATASYMLKSTCAHGWIDAGPFGSLGAGAGYALAACALKEKNNYSQIVLLYGDGAAGFSIMDVDTLVRNNYAVLIVVGNNGSWQQIKRDQVEVFDSDVAVNLSRSKYEHVASLFDCEQICVGSYDEQETVTDSLIADKIIAALNLLKQNKTVIMNVLIEEDDFRKGSISV